MLKTERLYLRWLWRGRIWFEKQSGATRRKAKDECWPVAADIVTRAMLAALDAKCC